MRPVNFINTDTLFVHTPKVCRRCGLASTQYYFATEEGKVGGYICPKCKYEMNPPEMFLQILQSHHYPKGGIYSPYTRRMETVLTLDDFQNCGWFIKRRWIHGSKDVRSLGFKTHVVEVIQLRYYGERKCKRSDKYKYWPLDNKKCNCVYCNHSFNMT